MANSSELRLSYVEEVTFGVTPNSAMDDVRFTSEGLKQRTDIVSSAEIRADRQVPDIARTRIGAEGPIGFELSYGSFDPFLKAALFSAAWSTVQNNNTNFTTTPATGTIAESTPAGGFANFNVGQWVRITGFTDSSNDGYFKIKSKPDNNTITVAGKKVLPSETAKALNIRQGAQIVNGVTAVSYSLEKEWTDLSSELAVYRGMMIDQFSMELPSDNIITGSFGFLGKSAASLTATAGNGTKNAAPSTEIINTVDDVFVVMEGTPAVNVANVFSAESLAFQLNNKVRQRNIIGTLGAIEQKAGTVEITGTLRAYFATKAIMDKYLNFTDSAVAAVIEDGAGNAYVIDMPAVNYEDGQRVAGGIDQDVMVDLSFRAKRHATEDVMLRIARFAA